MSLVGKPSTATGRKFPQASGKNHHNWKGGKAAIKCDICHNIFFAYSSNKRKLCGRQCAEESLRRKYSGDKNPAWNGGITPLVRRIRNSGKYKDWAMSILIRDGFICQICGQRGGNNLEVDHIKSFAVIVAENKLATFDDALKCNELWILENGRTLCKPCHLQTPSYLKNLKRQNVCLVK